MTFHSSLRDEVVNAFVDIYARDPEAKARRAAIASLNHGEEYLAKVFKQAYKQGVFSVVELHYGPYGLDPSIATFPTYKKSKEYFRGLVNLGKGSILYNQVCLLTPEFAETLSHCQDKISALRKIAAIQTGLLDDKKISLDKIPRSVIWDIRDLESLLKNTVLE